MSFGSLIEADCAIDNGGEWCTPEETQGVGASLDIGGRQTPSKLPGSPTEVGRKIPHRSWQVTFVYYVNFSGNLRNGTCTLLGNRRHCGTVSWCFLIVSRWLDVEQMSLVYSSNATWFDTTVPAHLVNPTVFFLWKTLSWVVVFSNFYWFNLMWFVVLI